MVRLHKIRTVLNDGPLFPLSVDPDLAANYRSLIAAQPGVLRIGRVVDGKSFAGVLAVDGIGNARALHRLLTDPSTAEVVAFEDAIAAEAARVGTDYAMTWKLTL